MSREQKGYRAPCGTENSNRASTLFHIPPQGLGTPFTESLTGLIARESLAHGVPPGRLIRYTIAPVKQGSQASPLWTGDYRYVNGVGPNARWWAEAMEGLTQNHNLKYLTMLTWAEVISPIGLLKSSQAWCPQCLRKWMDDGQAYDPLLWTINMVKVCPEHGVSLVTRCPACGREIPVLQWQYEPGLCPYCGRDLSEGDSVEPDEQCRERDLWYATSVGELIATAPDLVQAPSLEYLVDSISTLTRAGLPIAAIERITGVGANVMRNWAPGKAALLRSLLKLSYLVRIPLLTLLTQPHDLSPLGDTVLASRQAAATTRSRLKADGDLFSYCDYLRSVLREDPPPSLRQAADRIGASPSTLYYHCAELCKEITARYKHWKESQRSGVFRQLQPDEYRHYLKQALDSDEFPFPSVADLANRKGIRRCDLYRRAADLCYQVTARHKREQEVVRQKELAQRRAVVRGVILRLLQDGVEPRYSRVQEALKRDDKHYSQGQISAIRHDVLRELGLE